MKQRPIQKNASTAMIKKKSKRQTAYHQQSAATLQQQSSYGNLNKSLNKKSHYMGQIRYADINSNSTQPMTGNFLSETECKSIEEAVAKEVLGEPRGNKTTGQREGELSTSRMLNKSTHSRKSSTSQLRLMTFKELRELQKTAATSNIGPGSYEPQEKKMQDITFGKRRYDKLQRTPGPGEYELDSGVNQTKCSQISYQMRGKSKELKVNTTLGPGDYDTPLNDFGQQAVKVTMGGKKYDTVKNQTPPVGSYDVAKSIQYLKPRGSQFTMTSRYNENSQNRGQRDQSPGPCQYNTTREFGADTTSASIRGRPKWKPQNINPGPGDYENRNNPSKPRTPAFDMSKTKSRNYKRRDNTPSVGQYNTHKPFGADITGGTIGLKQQWRPRDNNPAPGQYNPNKEATMCSTTKSFDISKSPITQSRLKYSDKATDQLQGVSYDYQKPFGSDAKAVSISSKPKFKPLNNNPAPGQYNPKLNAIMPNQNNLMTSKSQRTLKVRNKNPEAGMYQKLDQFGKNAPKFTMKGKDYKNQKNRNPSPLQYDPSYKLVKPRADQGAFIKREQMVLVDVSKYL